MLLLLDIPHGHSSAEGVGPETQHNPAEYLRLLAQRMLSQKLALLAEE